MSYTPETKPVHEQEPCGCIGLGFAVHFCPLHTAAPELVAAVKHAKRDAESRLYMLKVNADALERQIIEAQITIYPAALARVKGE